MASPKGPGRDSIEAYRDVVYGFCQALGLQRIVLAGHSMGSAITLDFALHYPQRLAGIVLVGSGARLRVAPAILEGLRSDFPATAKMITEWTHDPDAPEQMKRLFLQRLMENNPDVLYGDYVACDHFDLRADIARIQPPALVICGGNDRMTPVKYSEYLVENLPNARLVLIPRRRPHGHVRGAGGNGGGGGGVFGGVGRGKVEVACRCRPVRVSGRHLTQVFGSSRSCVVYQLCGIR